MTKLNIKAFKVVVGDTKSLATLICVTHQISNSLPYYEAKFYELVSSFDNSGFKIPDGGHTFTFQEELRIFATASAITPTDRQNIEDLITSKMKEAYGQNCKVTVEPFPAK